MKSAHVLYVAVAAALALVAFAAPAQPKADNARSDARTAPSSLSVPSPLSSDETAAVGVSANGAWAPVMMVTEVEVMRSARPPELDIIRVHGLSSTDTWDAPQLVPLTRKPSADGVLELLFVARAPSEGITPTNYGVLEAIFVVEPGHPYKGVRVRGALNSLSVARLPGYAEAAPPKIDCSNCVGKYYVAKGQQIPAGRSAGDVVMESDLPAAVRVMSPTNGVGKLDVDPNRLTLFLGADGRIVSAVWD